MPKLKHRKDGGYYLHAFGDENPINTFQVTNGGDEIVKSSGRKIGEFFPDQLFFLLYDLGPFDIFLSILIKMRKTILSDV